MLEDFTNLVDEINDNLDQFEARKFEKDVVKEYHKGLKELIEADERFDQRLKTLKSTSESASCSAKAAARFPLCPAGCTRSVLKSYEDTAREYMGKYACTEKRAGEEEIG